MMMNGAKCTGTIAIMRHDSSFHLFHFFITLCTITYGIVSAIFLIDIIYPKVHQMMAWERSIGTIRIATRPIWSFMSSFKLDFLFILLVHFLF